MSIQEENLFTEEQAINITIENNYDGAEFETSAWKSRGCLKPDRTLKALISKLQTIYNNVEVIGKGKKRQYILSDKKNEVSERTFNYKGSVATTEDEIMKEYIFNQLVKVNIGTHSYKGWARTIGFCNTDALSIDELINTIKDLHIRLPFIYNPKEIVSKFIYTLDVRNKDVVEKSFKRLEKEGRISVKEIYNFKTIDGDFEEVDQVTYDEAHEKLKEFIESKGITYYAYTQSVSNFHKPKKMKEIIREVEKYLEDEYGIEFLFKAFRVVVLDSKINKEVSKEEFNQAYFNRLIKLSQDRQNKDEYKDSIIFWKRFYLLHTLVLLDYLKINEVEELLKSEKKSRSEKIETYSLDVMMHKFEADKERENRRHTFGSE